MALLLVRPSLDKGKGHLSANHQWGWVLFYLFAFSRAAPMAYGGLQARGLSRTVATGLCQSHSTMGSEAHLRPIPQLAAMPDP